MHDIEYVVSLAEVLVSPVQRGVRRDNPDIILGQKPFADRLLSGNRISQTRSETDNAKKKSSKSFNRLYVVVASSILSLGGWG